jgi:hypothetical protein
MPYLQFLFCEKCGDHHNLDVDPVATINSYIEEGRKSTSINPATIVWDYLVYSCSYCKAKYRYGYRDVEKRVREYLSSLGSQYKAKIDHLVKTVDQRIYQPETVERVKGIYTKK